MKNEINKRIESHLLDIIRILDENSNGVGNSDSVDEDYDTDGR